MIELIGIHKQYRGSPVLQGVDLHVARGEVSVLLGPSGGGKSTLLRSINGLETIDRGEIRIDDLRWDRTTASTSAGNEVLLQIRRRVGMVFQQFHLFPHLSALENVMEGPRHVLRVSRAQAEVEGRELLRRVGLESKVHARPSELSGGQQQRVAIARTLAMRPQAILFDEPTSALDPHMTAEVVDVIADLAREGQTTVVVTHSLSFARRIGHTVHVMSEGRIAESGPPNQVFTSPRHPVTRSFLADAS